MIRGRYRLIHKTLVDYMTTEFDVLGWRQSPYPFGVAHPVTILEAEVDDRRTEVLPNTVAITLGDEDVDSDEELGAQHGGLQSVDIPLYVDIYGEELSVSNALAGDAKNALKNRWLPLRNWALPGAPAVPGYRIEIDNVQGPERPPLAAQQGGENFKRHWRVVKAMTRTYFSD